MKKKKSLASSLADQEAASTAVVEPPVNDKPKPLTAKDDRPDRVNKVPVTGWFPQRVKLELEAIKIERSRELGRNVKLQEVMAEAYNDLFKKHGRAELAPVESE